MAKNYEGPSVKDSVSGTHVIIEDLGRMLFVHRNDINGLIYKLRLAKEKGAPRAELP